LKRIKSSFLDDTLSAGVIAVIVGMSQGVVFGQHLLRWLRKLRGQPSGRITKVTRDRGTFSNALGFALRLYIIENEQ